MNRRRISTLAALAACTTLATFSACGGADSRDTDRMSVAANEPSSVMYFDSTKAVIPGAPAAAGGAGGATAVNGAEVFTRCAACHQANGMGVPGAYPPLAGSEWLLGNPEVPIRIVLHGLQGPITVKSGSFNSAMTPFADQLSDAEIAAVISYERSSWGNSASKITAEQVAAVRAATKAQTAPWKPDELKPLVGK
jgi:mono/diheme cytochrome c family protein